MHCAYGGPSINPCPEIAQREERIRELEDKYQTACETVQTYRNKANRYQNDEFAALEENARLKDELQTLQAGAQMIADMAGKALEKP